MIWRLVAHILNRREERLPSAYREFQPSAQMIEETPASPALRITALTIIAFFFGTIVWASIGQVDITASARGKLVPNRNVKTIQPHLTATIKAIHVANGQSVEEGDMLIELDSGALMNDLTAIEYQLQNSELDYMLINYIINQSYVDECSELVLPKEALSRADIENSLHMSGYISLLEETRATCSRLKEDVETQRAVISATEKDIERQRINIPLIQDRFTRVKQLSDKELMSKITALQVEQELRDAENRFQSSLDQLEAERKRLKSVMRQVEQQVGEFRRRLGDRLTDVRLRRSVLREERDKLDSQIEKHTLRSPIKGQVQQLSVSTVGGVVTTAENLMIIVPDEAQLQAEVFVPNKDIGFIDLGQDVEVKVDGFKYTLYGLLHGKVIFLSRTSVQTDPVSPLPATNPVDQEAFYSARISLDKQWMNIDGRKVDLTPGMNVTAEVKTGKQRIIEFLLSPILKYKHEALRER